MLNWIKRIFSTSETKSKYERYLPGDFIYTKADDGYHISRVLRHEPDHGGVHLSMYNVIDEQPTPNHIDQLTLFIQHVPMSVAGLTNPQFILNTPLQTEDLEGYYTYLEATEQNEFIPWHYLERANSCAEQKNHQRAISILNECVEAYPTFYQALDNIAFSYMDLGKWEKAIEHFEQSIGLNPDGLHATFSLGEAHLKAGNKSDAKPYFERALELQPDLEVAKQFLEAYK